MAASAPDIAPEAFIQVASVLERWGAAHPLPDVPVLSTAEGFDITPREIAVAMGDVLFADRAPDTLPPAARTVRMLFSAALFEADAIDRPPENLDAILVEFKRDIDRWSGLGREPEAFR